MLVFTAAWAASSGWYMAEMFKIDLQPLDYTAIVFFATVNLPAIYIVLFLHHGETLRLSCICDDFLKLLLETPTRPTDAASYTHASEAHDKVVKEFARMQSTFQWSSLVVLLSMVFIVATFTACLLFSRFAPSRKLSISVIFLCLPPALGIHRSVESANDKAEEMVEKVSHLLSDVADAETSICAMKFVMLCERRRCELVFFGQRPPSSVQLAIGAVIIILIQTGSYLGLSL